MFAGIPGIGVGTLFYVLMALWLPVQECGRVLAGRSSWRRWRSITVQFCHAIGIVASIALAERALLWLLGVDAPNSVSPAGVLNDRFAAWVPQSILAAPITASLVVLACVLVTIEVVRLMSPSSRRPGIAEGRARATLPSEVLET